MASWQNRALMLPLLTLHLAWLFPHASFESSVKCWWRRASSASHNVSIECQADPQGSMPECELCHVRPLKPAEHILQTGCSHTNVSFQALLGEHEMQSTIFKLLCPGRTPLSCGLQAGYPPPTCLIPFYDEEGNIHCHWRALFNSLIPTNFTLHWRAGVGNGHNVSKDFGESDSGIIERSLYESHGLITVWVTAANRLGTVDSERLVTNTKRIFQPVTPNIRLGNSDPLEIKWVEDYEQTEQLQCKVQYKKKCDKDWTEAEDTYQMSFILEDALPFTTYEFRVRCSLHSDERSMMSDWSSELTAKTPAAAPVGMLDVWSDCESTSDDPSCTILWKEMPMQQARGKINNYLVTMKLTNGSVLNLNGSLYKSAETCVHCGLDIVKNEPSYKVSPAQQSYLRCSQDQEQSCFHYCHLSVPVKEVNIIGVTANTTGGKSSPALVALPRPGQQQSVALEISGKSQELNISWSVHPQFTGSVQEYVVQHKPIGLPNTPCVNWMKVHKNKTFVTLRGQLLNYTAYNVSVFAVVNNQSCLLNSAIAYTVEGVPPEVTDFQAIPTSPYSVNLIWTPISLNKSHGHIMQYLVGLHDDVVQGCNTASEPRQVHRVSSSQSSFQISDLNPDKQYVVWISAKTSAGEGNRTTACFTTSSGDINIVLPIIIALIAMTLLISISVCIMWKCLRTKVTEWFYNIPDPINSSSFKQMSNQFWHSLPVRSSSMECGLAISQVEIVPKPEVDPEPEMTLASEEEHREQGQDREKELQGYGGVEQNNPMPSHQTEYSQMIDSSDEDDGDDWNEQPFPSDYEKHFLPCIVEA